jgi:hypothetical protein
VWSEVLDQWVSLLNGLLGIWKGKTVWRVVEVWGEHWNCEREGPSSNPAVTQFFFCLFLFWTLSIREVVHLPAVDHKQKIDHNLDYLIATSQFGPKSRALFPPKVYWMSPVLQLVITIPGLWLQSMLWLDSPIVDIIGERYIDWSTSCLLDWTHPGGKEFLDRVTIRDTIA